ncbi:DUF5686 and carboxypeptidase-like regulatory domain-containing protein [Dyadobacter fanqingshengii]|uniref:DUF5686 and carboxypeptidase regulatory-like domain-containing protein n=1 Tax=Dyadobacter fanqingshengii TaxID=2906443 RepID=A0A9X1TIG6_9BACT|nr:DUF5686 and carboxypeptidase-like regulatory domain-containing protein [Dyadobacter fanqingshengii]MCF0042802.1 DUF5686 and carboxypeptidase regulatory-like domain-containing protein [Dyadobacter fanqingshengii]USJ35979.1 DUF5686 and carboxypeptidase regulatory-like domain-containing protein [Dyadobacter fanqingshengii]
MRNGNEGKNLPHASIQKSGLKRTLLYFVFIVLVAGSKSFSQTTYTIKGKITDASTGDAIPFANVGIKASLSGATTNFDGFYQITFTPPADSILVTYVGYESKSKPIKPDVAEQTIDIQLSPGTLQLREVKIFAGENPAYAIMRKIVAGKNKNNTDELDAYEYESYNKIQIDIDNLSDKFRNRKSVKKMTHIVDKYDEVKGENGETIIPIFISESVSDVYYRRNPKKKKEIINKTKVSGVGLTDGSLVSQVIGSSFQQYNFYNNWLNILDKDFVSPIADSWKVYYEYYLSDSVKNGDKYDYQIDFEPKHEQDLAFTGSFWVDGDTYALTQMDVNVGKRANLNFIEKIKIQQSYEFFEEQNEWVTSKTRVLIDVDEPTKQTAGMLLKFYSANSKYKINNPRDPKFYDTAIELKEDYMQHDSTFWQKSRPEALSSAELLSFQLVDSLKVLPVVKTYTEILNIFVNGYKRIDKWNIDVGPYLFLYANNNIEGHRVRLGFKTDPGFSRKWIFNGYGAYGTKDKEFKYGAGMDYIFDRKPWTVGGISYSKDLERLGLSAETIGPNTLFGAFSRFGTFRRAYWQEDISAYFKRELVKGLTGSIQIRHRDFRPLFPFTYRTNPEAGIESPVKSTFDITEINLETRLASKETFLQNDNERISMGNGNSPAFTLRYTLGIRNFLGGDFNYNKFSFNIKQSFRFGVIGRTYYNVTFGLIPSTLPYPLLYTPLGNESLFYVDNAFNLMRYFEFMSDRYVSLRMEHNFEGFLLNRIPAIKKLKLRMLATGKLFYGSVSDANLELSTTQDESGNEVQVFNKLKDLPYIELGYGIDNILKFGRVDFVHRLTYLKNPNVTPFAVKISFWFSL